MESGELLVTQLPVLVLGPDNSIHGSAFVTIALVNNGLVNPEDPISGGTGDKITLTCNPKLGAGDWKVTCADCDAVNEKNTLLIEAPVVGTGDLVVGHHGLLQVKRMLSLHGDFEMSTDADDDFVIGGKIEVEPGVLFDVDRFTSLSCPQ